MTDLPKVIRPTISDLASFNLTFANALSYALEASGALRREDLATFVEDSLTFTPEGPARQLLALMVAGLRTEASPPPGLRVIAGGKAEE